MSLEILTSDALHPLQHGFFTRAGGASSGVFSGLNCGLGSSDLREIVEINRSRVAEAMDLESPEHIIGMNQIHSATVKRVDSPSAARAEADAMVTATSGLALAILTADCQPVLLADQEAGVIGAAHAGWRGALDGVLEATVEAMEDLGAQRARIAAIIGPSISQRAYEVGPEFLDLFVDDDAGNARFFANGKGDRFHFDLPAFGLHRLRAAGVGTCEWTRHCTYSDPKRFFSYRRSVHAKEADYGRLIATIRL